MINHEKCKLEIVRSNRKSVLLLLLLSVLLFFFGEFLFGTGWPMLFFISLSFIIGEFVARKKEGQTNLFAGRTIRELDRDNSPELFSFLDHLINKSDLKFIPRVFLIHEQSSNAFATGSRQRPELYLTSGLLSSLSSRELVGVFAHELAHLEHRDMILLRFINTSYSLATFFTLYAQLLVFVSIPLMIFGVVEVSLYFLLLFLFFPFMLRLVSLALMRSREFAADLRAVYWTEDPKGLASALAKINYFSLKKSSLFSPKVHKVRRFSLYDSHPPAEERIKRLLGLEQI